MKEFNLLVASAGALTMAQPALAQSAADATEGAAEAVAEAAADAVRGSAAPPPIKIVPIESDHRSSGKSRRPKLQNRSRGWIVQADYPISSWNADEEGTVRYNVSVDATGNATGCEVAESSGFAALDEAICPLVFERAEFFPASNEDGEDVAGVFEGRHSWRKKEPDMPQMRVVFQYFHSAKGVTTDCDILSIEGDISERMQAQIERDRERGRLCPGPKARPGAPYRDENGVPVAKRVTATINVVLEDLE